jgi:ankyrin repeat protein
MKILIPFLVFVLVAISCQREDKQELELRNPVSDEVLEKANDLSKAIEQKDYKKADELMEEIGPTDEEEKVVDNLVEKFGKSNILLWISAPTGDLLSARQAIKDGANVNFEIGGQGGPLLGAIQSGNIKLISYLLEKGSNVNTRNLSGATPLSIAVSTGRLDLVKLLVKNKAKFSRGGDPRNESFSILTVALSTGKMEIFNYLLSQGADPNGANGLPLAFGIMLKNEEAIKTLIKKGADINYSGKDGFRPIMTAVIEGNKEIIKLLLDLGANPNLKDSTGKDAYAWAKKHKSKGGDVLRELLSKRNTDKN